MAEENGNGEATNNAAEANGALPPQAGMLSHYVKDLSVENPNTPDVYQWDAKLGFEVQFQGKSTQLNDELHEMISRYTLTAKAEQGTAFIVELAYAALVGARGMSAEDVRRFLFAEVPALVFPNIRLIMANAVRDAGFAPTFLESIDFAALYEQRMAEGNAPQDMTPQGNA